MMKGGRKSGFYKVKYDGKWEVAHFESNVEDGWSLFGSLDDFKEEHFDIIVENPIEFRENEPEYVVIDMRHSDDFLYFLGQSKVNSASLVADLGKAYRYKPDEIEALRGIRANERALLALPLDLLMTTFESKIQFPLHIETLKSAIKKHKLEKYII